MYYLHGEIGDSTAPPTVLSAFPAEHLSNQQEFGAYFLKFPLLPEWAFLSWRLSPQPLAWLLMLPLPHLIFVIFFLPSYLVRNENHSLWPSVCSLFKSQVEFISFQDGLKVM